MNKSLFAYCRNTDLKSVIRGCNNNTPLISSSKCSDILVPAFSAIDSIVAANGLGPGGNEVPISVGGAQALFSDASVAPFPTYWHAVDSDEGITVRTADPPAGVTHYFEWDVFPLGINGVGVGMAAGGLCASAPDYWYWYTSTIKPGELISISYQGKAAGTVTSPTFLTRAAFIKSDLSSAGAPTQVDSLTSSYVSKLAQFIAPAQAYAVLVTISSNQTVITSSTRHRLGDLNITIS